ncbi:MAG TPA: serine hydrolase [Anaerolineales bacterium]|nr:serine hydrolase [Anaerolineales bacterium]
MITKEKNKTRSLFRRVITWLFALVLALAVVAGGIYLWAYLSTGTSLVARGIMWGDSDAGDLYRFPTREVQASTDPFMFESAPEGVLSELLVSNATIQAIDMPFETFLEATNTTAFIVLHGDVLLYEGYFNGAERESIHGSFSAAKPFTSTLVGIALAEGYIHSLDDPITDYLPELIERDPRFEEITIRHLITMTSGLRWDRSDSNPFSDDFISYYSPDLRATALETQIVETPGQRFLYNDYNPLLAGMILERATGMSVSAYLETRLWKPMGAEGGGSWSLDSEQSGFEKMFVGVNGRAIDLIKLGWLFLNDGKAGDKQVVPQGWVKQVTDAREAIYTDRGLHANHYQSYWWLDVENEAYYAEGDKCQFIYVHPKADLVLARFGTDCGGYAFGLDAMIVAAQYLEHR